MAALCPASNSKCQWHGVSRRWKPLQCLPTQPPPIIPVHPGHPSVRIVLGPNLQDILRLSYYPNPNPEWWGAGVVVSLERGADLHMAQLMPLPLTVSCFSKIQIGFTFLVSAHPGSPGKGQLNRCVCVYLITLILTPSGGVLVWLSVWNEVQTWYKVQVPSGTGY